MNITISIETIANRMVNLARCMNFSGHSGNRYAHQFRELKNLLRSAGADVDFDWNENVTKMTAIIINGQRFTVAV